MLSSIFSETKNWIAEQSVINFVRFSEQLLTFEFARVNTEVFSRVGLVL
jgi:hypothetical protein